MERKRAAAEVGQERRTKVLEAMRTGDWTGFQVDPTNYTTQTH